MLGRFLFPYVALLNNAAWSVHQNLEGAGLSSSSGLNPDLHGYALGTAWDPGAYVLELLGLFFIAFICGCLFFVLAGYVISRRIGTCIALTVVLSPGILSIVGLWPVIPLAPERFTIDGAGVTGSTRGMLSLVALAVTAGWTFTILATDSLRLRGKFWDIYDHFWLVLGLLAAIFFVIDSQIAEHEADFRATESDTQRANAYLLKQVEAYSRRCHQTSADILMSCEWASDVYQRLFDASFEGLSLFAIFGPNSSADMHGRFNQVATPAKMDAIRIEIGMYNQTACPVTTIDEQITQTTLPSPDCQTTPPQFCKVFPEPLGGKVDRDVIMRSVALATECVIPTLVRLRLEGQRLVDQTKYDRQNRNYRWMYFLFFAVVLGGKLAGTTAKLASLNTRPDDETQRVFRLLRQLSSSIWNVMKRVGGHGLKLLRLRAPEI